MSRYHLFIILLSFVMTALAQEMEPLDKLNSGNASNLLKKELAVITPDVVQELVGTWYVDNEEFLNMMVTLGAVKQSDVAGARNRLVKQREKEKKTGGNPESKFIVYPDLTSVNGRHGARKPIVTKVYRIEIPSSYDESLSTNVYRVGSRFYFGSRELGLSPITKTPPW